MTATTASSTPGRAGTDVDAVAEAFVDRWGDLSPVDATFVGLPGHDDALDDFSPAGWAAKADARAATLAALEKVAPVDDVDRVTLEAMRERLGVEQERYAAGLDEMRLNVLESPLQAVRDVLDLMPTDTAQQWDALTARLSRIPTALAQWRESLRAAASRGRVSPRRQVAACIEQAREFAGDDGYFADLTLAPRTATGDLAREGVHRLERAADAAREGYAQTARWLADVLLTAAPEADACGRERYELESRVFLGARVDLEETYDWGQRELARITAEIRTVAERFAPSGRLDEAAAALDADPRYRLEGTDALREWMQATADGAVDALAGRHFDIPAPVRALECRIAPTASGGIYYTGPSEDFSRPGRMWWSVPRGVTSFGTWRERTTVYHEGVPGHHLQIGQAVVNAGRLNRWRRLFSFTSGHGEGWALYAERLMAELGYVDDPGDRLGYLDAQSLRAARVVLDIGVHCGFPAPAEAGGGAWTYASAWAFLRAHTSTPHAILRFELDRYLGWPGQAPSYKIGERLWLQLREDDRARRGESFSEKKFHRRALDLGGVGLDTLRTALLSPGQT